MFVGLEVGKVGLGVIGKGGFCRVGLLFGF